MGSQPCAAKQTWGHKLAVYGTVIHSRSYSALLWLAYDIINGGLPDPSCLSKYALCYLHTVLTFLRDHSSPYNLRTAQYIHTVLYVYIHIALELRETKLPQAGNWT